MALLALAGVDCPSWTAHPVQRSWHKLIRLGQGRWFDATEAVSFGAPHDGLLHPPATPQGTEFQLSAENQRGNHHFQPHPTRQKFKPQMGRTHDHSKMNLEQALSGTQLSPGTRWRLQLHLDWPALQLSEKIQQAQCAQAHHTRKKFNPPW